MRLLTGQAIADEGSLRVLGHELPAEAKEARAEMGVVPQLDNLDVDVSVEDNLAVFARLYRVKDVRAAVDRGLELARLTDRRADSVDQLSGGMRRRLLLARGLMHEPRPDAARRAHRRARPADPHPALVADRPAALPGGDDPDVDPLHRGGPAAGRRGRRDGAGKIIARGKPGELIAKHAGRETAEVYAPPERLAEVRATAEAHGLTVRPAGPGDRDRRIGARHRRRDPAEAIRRAASLEDVFVLLTGEEAEMRTACEG